MRLKKLFLFSLFYDKKKRSKCLDLGPFGYQVAHNAYLLSLFDFFNKFFIFLTLITFFCVNSFCETRIYFIFYLCGSCLIYFIFNPV